MFPGRNSSISELKSPSFALVLLLIEVLFENAKRHEGERLIS